VTQIEIDFGTMGASQYDNPGIGRAILPIIFIRSNKFLGPVVASRSASPSKLTGNAVKWISILSLMRNATLLRKLEKIPLSEEKFGRLHFFQPPRTHKSKTFLHSLPGGFAPPLPHPFGHESPRGHYESFALVLPPLGQAAAEVHIRYSIHSIADMDLLTAAYKNRPARNGAERYLPAHPS